MTEPRELTEIYNSLDADHKNDLLNIAKMMQNIEKQNAWLASIKN